ncbi:MBL fold metallo-hydrolase [candidate division KSB1 bacterium]
MDRRQFLETGLVAGAAVATVGGSAIGADSPGSPDQVRKIKDQLYGTSGYDAVWFLANCGFCLRLGGEYLFIDPMFRADMFAEQYAPGRKHELSGEHSHYTAEDIYRHRKAARVPLAGDEVERADCILMSHGHMDHFDPESIGAVAHLNPKVVAPEPCHQDLLKAGIGKDSLIEAEYGKTFDFENFKVKVIFAEHKHFPYPGGCGYLIETTYGNFYFPGDTGFDHPHKKEMLDLDVDFLLLPINDTNFGVGFAALLAHILQPKVIIPCHYGFTWPPVRSQGGHPAELLTVIESRDYKLPNTDIVVLKPGGRYVLV